MVKNKLESKFSESYRAHPRHFWGMKLQNNLLAHTVTPADFLIHFHQELCVTDRTPHQFLTSCLVECKQVTCEAGESDRLAFKRLKQMHDMLSFESFSKYHRAYFLVGFLESRWENSEVYLVPVKAMRHYVDNCSMVSINRNTFKEVFGQHKIRYDSKLLNVHKIMEMNLWQNDQPENSTL